MSDTFASALWGADYLFDLAEQGVVGANFHGGFSTHGYTPIALDKNSQYFARPLYYGMLLFHAAAEGRIVPVQVNTPLNVTAHAVLGSDGSFHLVIINKDAEQPISAEIDSGKPYSSAMALRLLAPSLDAQDGITLAGSSVSTDGTWLPSVEERVDRKAAAYQIAVPPASAVIVTFK